MTEMIKCEIGDLCNTISETYRGNDEEVILVNTSDVLDGKILNHKRIKNEKLKGQFKKTFLQDDILYSEIRPANRRFAYVDVQDTSLYIASTKLMVLRCNTDIVIPKFLFAILTSQTMIDELQLRAESRSGTFPQITFGAELAPIKVNIPDKETQLKIVSMLESFQKKLETNNKINWNLSEQLDAIYAERFSSECNGILADLCDYSKARVDVESLTEETYYSTENMLPNKAGATVASGLPTSGKTPACSKGNVLISNIRPYFKKIVYCHGDAGCSADVLCFAAKTPALAPYIYSTLYTDKFFDYMVAGSKGTKMPRGDKQQIMQYPVHLPTDTELEVFASIAENILEMIHKNRIANKKLEMTRDSLLPKLMSGELDISDLVI